QIYVDGVLVASATTGGSGHTSDSTQTLQLGSGVFGAVANSKGCIALAAFGCKMLNTNEVKSLSNNPWQVFAPKRRVIAFDVPVVGGGTVDLVGQSLTQTDTVSNGEITQIHALSGNNLNQIDTVSNGTITQIHSLTGADLVQTDTVSNGTITSTVDLIGANLSQVDTISNGVVTQAINLSAFNLSQFDTVSNGSVSQIHKPTGQNVTQTDVVSSGSISIGELKTGRDFLNSVFYSPAPPPYDAADLQRYLFNELQAIQTAIMQLAEGHIDVTNVAPKRPREGDIRLCDGVNWNPTGTGKKFVGYRGGAWVELG
ncbi:MAG: hypothetical protein WBI40_13180, partial [Methylococcaceae bacterium]